MIWEKRLMEKILHHSGCTKMYYYYCWDKATFSYFLRGPGFLPSTVGGNSKSDHSIAEVYHIVFPMRHYGHESVKPTMILSNNKIFWALKAGRLSRRKRSRAKPTTKRYRDSSGRLRFCGTPKLKTSQKLGWVVFLLIYTFSVPLGVATCRCGDENVLSNECLRDGWMYFWSPRIWTHDFECVWNLACRTVQDISRQVCFKNCAADSSNEDDPADFEIGGFLKHLWSIQLPALSHVLFLRATFSLGVDLANNPQKCKVFVWEIR